MSLWLAWMQAVRSLRPACRRSRTFLWMVLTLMGLCCRSDHAGVTSYIRILGLGGKAYHRFLHLFHSQGLDLDRLTDCMRLTNAPVRSSQSVMDLFHGRRVWSFGSSSWPPGDSAAGCFVPEERDGAKRVLSQSWNGVEHVGPASEEAVW